jgi:hypothetical protein
MDALLQRLSQEHQADALAQLAASA